MPRLPHAERLRLNRERLRLDPSLAPHGSASTYRNWGCRCVECRAAHTAWSALARERRKARLAGGTSPESLEHGSPWTYGNHGCRCTPCTQAWRIYSAGRRVARP